MKRVCIFFLLFSFIHFSYSQWEWQNPYPQGNTLTDVVFLNEYTGWAVGDCGTVIKTMDGGHLWEHHFSKRCIDFLALSFPDQLHGFVLGNQDSLYVTIDGGMNWDARSFENPWFIEMDDIYFIDGDFGWAIGNLETILFTSDGGVSWASQYNCLGRPRRQRNLMRQWWLHMSNNR